MCIQCQFLGRALQQFQQCLGGTGTAQGLAQIGLAEGTGKQLQQTQVLVGCCRDADGQIDDLAVPPIHALGKLQQAHAGGEHLITGLRGAMGNRNTLAEKGRALHLTILQAGQVTLGHQAVSHQCVRKQLQGGRLIDGRLAHGNLLYGEFEHAFLLYQCQPPAACTVSALAQVRMPEVHGQGAANRLARLWRATATPARGWWRRN